MKKQKFNKVIVTSIIIALVMSMMFEGSNIKAKVTSIGITEAWNLVWSDEFNGEIGSAPDEQTWNYDVGATGWGNNEIQNYRKSTDNVYIADISQENILSDDNKALAIKLKKESDGKYTSGRIHTLKKQYFKYGRVEAKLKVENGSQAAVWPAFWMMGNNYNPSSSNYDGSKGTSPWPACGEIDIMEHRNTESVSIGTMHWNTSLTQYGRKYNGSEKTGKYGNIGSIESWHTYALEWYENCLKWYVDDECFQTLSITDEAMDEFQRDMFIIFNVALGGPNTGFTKKQTVSESFTYATMYVDYVRIYQGSDDSFKISKTNDISGEVATIMPNGGTNDSEELFTTTEATGYNVGFANAMSIVNKTGNSISEAKVGETIGFKLRYKNKGTIATTGEEDLGVLSISVNSETVLQENIKLKLEGNSTIYQTYFWKIDSKYAGQKINVVANFAGATKTGTIDIAQNEDATANDETTTLEEPSSEKETSTVEESSSDVETSTVEESSSDVETSTVEESSLDQETSTVVQVESTTKEQTTEVSTTVDTTIDKDKVMAPARVKIKSVTKKKESKKVKLSIKKVKGAVAYRVQFSKTKKFKKVLLTKTVNKIKTTIKSKKLKNKKNLYVRVKAYKLNGNKKVWSKKWSKVKIVSFK